jgi:hypothetical protein
MTDWVEKKRKNKVRKDAKYDKVSVLPIVRSLVGLGFTETDIGIVLAVAPETVASWKARYPNMFEANKEGQQIMKGILCAELFRTAIGYDYEEKDVTKEKDEKGKEKITKTVVKTKHQTGNADLQKFLANNLMKEVFPRDPSQSQGSIINIISSVEPDLIKQFAGHLIEMSNKKFVESTGVDNDRPQ